MLQLILGDFETNVDSSAFALRRPPLTHRRTVVVGSGLAGLSAGYFCAKAGHQVTIFEAQPTRGMDAHGISIDGGAAGQGILDVPLRVMSVPGWKSVLELCRLLDVPTFEVKARVTMSWLDRKPWFPSSHFQLGPLSIPKASTFKYLNLPSILIGKHLLRLYQEPLLREQMPKWSFYGLPFHLTSMFLNSDLPSDQDQTIREFFESRNYHPLFWKGFLLPLLSTITTCRQEFLLDYPARALLEIVCGIIFGPRLRRIQGGTKTLVDQLSKGLTFKSGSPVVRMIEESHGVSVTNEKGETVVCDQVIFATQANQIPWIKTQYPSEWDILNSMVFDQGELLVHRDERVMPSQRSDWTTLSYQMDRDLNRSMFSVWTNPIEPSLSKHSPVFQSWNPLWEIPSDKVISRTAFERAVVTTKTAGALKDLQAIMFQPGRKVFFCGSWSYPGVPLLESAVLSAARIAQHLGIATLETFDHGRAS